MPIFSSNRVSYSGISVKADTRYTENDFGRIMQECATNDMKIFNAALARDFKEVQAKNEGTMLESELQAFQEFSVKEAWKSLKEKIKKLWAKIKGVFKTVYAKLTVWLVRDNKTFIAMHKKELLAKNCSECKVPKYRNPKKDMAQIIDPESVNTLKKDLEVIEKLDPSNRKDFITGMKGNGTSDDDRGIKGKTYKSDGGKTHYHGIDPATTEYSSTNEEIDIPSASDMYDEALKENFDDPSDSLTFGKTRYGTVTKLLATLSTNSDVLKGLKEQNRKIDKKFKSLLGKIEKAQKKAEADNNKAASNMYTAYNKYVTRYQTLLTNQTNCSIRLAKFAIKNDRGLVGTLVAYNPKAKNETAYLESAYMEGYDRLYLETDDMEPEDVEAAAEEEGIDIEITVSGDENVNVEVEDETDED